MANYKFPSFTTVFTNPTITINGEVGSRVVNNVPSDMAYCDILITTPQTKNSIERIEGSPKPVDWTMEGMSIWLAAQLVKYEV
jgi:hypothetical protein